MDFVDNVIDRVDRHHSRPRGVRQSQRRVHARHVRARARAGSPPYEALLVPDAAIGTEQARKFVLVVDADRHGAQKYVTLGQTHATVCASSRTGSAPTTASSSTA